MTAPTILTHPTATPVVADTLVTLTVSATGTAPLAYQWRRNGSAISGATAASYAFTAGPGDNGATYQVQVTNGEGSADSNTVTLSVSVNTAPPVISTQPAAVVAADGDAVTFTVVCTGASPLSYQWRRNGVAISGATAASYSTTATLAGHGGQFDVVVTNANGARTSRRAGLTVPVMSVAEARTAARIDDDRFDADLPRWIEAARSLAEQYCDTAFRPTTRRINVTDWPAATDALPVSAATGVAISYWADGAWQALDDADFIFYPQGPGTGLAPAGTLPWPVLSAVQGGPRVRVDISSGPATAAELPPQVAQYITAHCALWADEPRAATTQDLKPVPYLYALLDSLKVYI
jgi:hypothetical protein